MRSNRVVAIITQHKDSERSGRTILCWEGSRGESLANGDQDHKVGWSSELDLSGLTRVTQEGRKHGILYYEP